MSDASRDNNEANGHLTLTLNRKASYHPDVLVQEHDLKTVASRTNRCFAAKQFRCVNVCVSVVSLFLVTVACTAGTVLSETTCRFPREGHQQLREESRIDDNTECYQSVLKFSQDAGREIFNSLHRREEEIKELRNKLDAKEIEDDLLSLERVVYKAAFGEVAEERDGLKAWLASLTAERDDLKASLESVTWDKKSLEAKEGEAQKKLEKLNVAWACLGKERDDCEVGLREVTKKRDGLNASLASLETMQNGLKASLEVLEASVANLTRERDSLVLKEKEVENKFDKQNNVLESVVQERDGCKASLEAVTKERDAVTAAQATFILNFDDHNSSDAQLHVIPDGYHGLNFENLRTAVPSLLMSDCYKKSGFMHGVISDPTIAYNLFGDPASILAPAGKTISVLRFYATPVYRNNLQLTIEGLRGSTETAAQKRTVTLSKITQPTLVTLDGFERLTEIKFTTSGGVRAASTCSGEGSVAFDNIVYTINSA